MNWKLSTAMALTAALLATSVLSISRSNGQDVRPSRTAADAEGRVVAAAGLVEPASEARQLEATVVGRIMKMHFEEGDGVAEGEVIAEIENADVKAQLAKADATLAARSSELSRLKIGARKQEIEEAKAAVREAQSMAVLARSNFERQQALAERQIASKETVEKAIADRDAAEARRALLAERLSLLTAPPRHEDVAIAEANLQAAVASVDEIKAQIEKTIIRSPVAGTVLKVFRRTGETVSNLPPTPIATVGDTSRLRVRADVDEANVAQVTLGQSVWVTADAFRGKRFPGSVARIASQLGRKNFRSDRPEERVDTKVLEVLIDLDPDAQLPIGLPVDVIFDSSPANSKVKLSNLSLGSADLRTAIIR
jgi:HlyD family secretion protein